jgi:peptide/nickel transport system substrate-binding protein
MAHPPNSTDPDSVVIDTIFEPETLDPAWANDPASGEVIMNVYETLLFFDRNYKNGPYDTGKADQFVGKLATSWTEQSIQELSPDGLMWIKRYTFMIRPGVKFHDGTYMTPQDVEYSFERLLVQDRIAGPSWMLFEPLLGVYGAVRWDSDPYYGAKINHAIQSNTSAVWFNLLRSYPSEAFMQIFSQP